MTSTQTNPVSGDLTVDELMQFVERNSVKKYIFLCCFFMIFLMVQLYIVLVIFIPDAVGLHEEILSEFELSRLHGFFEKIAGFFMVWPVLLISTLVAYILNARKLRKIVTKIISNQGT